MNPIVQFRPFNMCYLTSPRDPAIPERIWSESASFPLLLEALRRHSEITSFGRGLFSGSQATKNLRWYQYRNLVRQALSNFSAALSVPNRSACLLYYYAMLNFAKAELLETHSNYVTGRIYHGLSFDPTAAKTIAGDRLVVRDGVFSLLYKKRTGRNIANGTMLPVRRLLANIPEIGQQVLDAGLGSSRVGGCLHMVASNGPESWPILILMRTHPTSWGRSTSSVFYNVFEEIDTSSPSTRNAFREHFGISKRS
jgi:hypothetical protein